MIPNKTNAARKPSYSSNTQTAPREKVSAPYNLVFRVGDELVRLTGLFQNESKNGKKYLGVKKLSAKDAAVLVEKISEASEGTEIGIFIFENDGPRKS